MDISGIYLHFKGKKYRVFSLAIDIETDEKYVFYQQLYDPFKYWIRPYNLFFSEKELDGKRIPRFIKISDDNDTLPYEDGESIQVIHSETNEVYLVESFDGQIYFVKKMRSIEEKE